MENKHNFTGIIIPVIVAVILLTVLPIINSINGGCPPCEEVPSYDIGNMEVNPNFSSGDYIVDKGDYDYLDNVTIIKDENLIPVNIKKDVNIYGVVGTYEGDGGISTNEAILLNEGWEENTVIPIIINLYSTSQSNPVIVFIRGAINDMGLNETTLATIQSQDVGNNIFIYLLEKSIYTHLKFSYATASMSNLYYFNNTSSTAINKNTGTYFEITDDIMSITFTVKL